MTIVRRPSPFGELLSLRSAMDRLFDDSFVRPARWTGGFDGGPGLPLDVSATSDEVRVDASLPGFSPEDVEITFEGGTLTISGQTNNEREQRDGSFLLQEIRHGSFSRSVSLPDGLEPERARATFDNGVLTIRIPKAEQVKPRQIRISPASEGSAAASPSEPHPVVEPAGAGD
ncbi:MAG: Hsp20/alpha crystallin family protein [Candidatus Limnocylindrales bacterium]